MTRRFVALFCICVLQIAVTQPVRAQGLGVVAIVNDVPITERDVSQRISLMKAVGDAPEEQTSRKQALQHLIDDVIKLAEAKRLKMEATDADIGKQVARVAKGLKMTPEGLVKQLGELGISAETFRRYVAAQTAFNRLITAKHRNDVAITPEDIDRKFADIKLKVDAQMEQIKKDPRMRPVTVYTLMEISLPLETEELLQARTAEAVQVIRQFKGCKNAKASASGVFNVKFSKPLEADSSKLDKRMKAALDKAGAGKVIGPMRTKTAIQLLAYCGARKISPTMPQFEMPTRQQVENALVNEKFDAFEETYLKDARKKVYVEYRNPAYTQ